MDTRILKTVALAAVLALSGAAGAAKIAKAETLKKGATLPAGQAAVLMVIDRGTKGSAVKRPPQASFELVAVATGEHFRLSDVDSDTVRMLAPGKYYLEDAYSNDRSMEILKIHDASQAFELKADVLNYVGAWKFSNNSTKNTGTIGLEVTFAQGPLEHALKDHPEFVGDGKVYINNVGQPPAALGAKK